MRSTKPRNAGDRYVSSAARRPRRTARRRIPGTEVARKQFRECHLHTSDVEAGGFMQFISAVLFIAMAVSSAGQESYSSGWNKKSTLTSEKAVEFPGIVLEP